MNLLALRGAVRTRIGVPTDDAYYTDAVVTDLVNQANHYIEVQQDWPWLEKTTTFPTVNGTEDYTPPNDWLRTIMLQVSDYPELTRMDISELRKMGAAAGRPIYYSYVGDQIKLRPIPTGVLTITHVYVSQEVDLSGDSDTPKLPGSYHMAIVEYAAYLAFRRGSNLQEAGGAQAAFQNWIDTLKARYPRYSPDEGGGSTPVPDQAIQAARGK